MALKKKRKEKERKRGEEEKSLCDEFEHKKQGRRGKRGCHGSQVEEMKS